MSLRLAALSDVHGNAAALRAVLADVDRLGVDAVVVCGDLVVYGPDPLEVLEILQARGDAVALLGNTDRYLVERRNFDPVGAEPWQRDLLGVFPWTAERIGKEGLRLLGSLSPQLHIPLLNGAGEIAFVHGSPHSDEEGIYAGDDGTGEVDIAGTEHTLLICGHTHLPFAACRVGGRSVLNLGSVGLPFDGDQRACYALIQVEGASIRTALRRVVYDVQGVIDRVVTLRVPGARITAENLLQARARGGTGTGSLIYHRPVKMTP
jgi:predicted phosphodiesterase